MAAILELVADGVGVAILSPHAVAASPHAATLAARPIAEPALRAHVALATSDRRPATLTQRAAADVIRELCRQRFGAPPAAHPPTTATAHADRPH